MTWLDAASLCVFLCNISFMVGAGLLLLKILGAVQMSEHSLQKVLAENRAATAQLRLVCNQIATAQESTEVGNNFRDTPVGKAHTALSEQVRSLSDQLENAMQAGVQNSLSQAKPENEELTQRLRDKLKDVLTQNISLKAEIERTKIQLRNASNSRGEIQNGIDEMQGASPAVVKKMTRMTEELRGDLEEAQRRALASEKLAESNAIKLEDMREAMSAKGFGDRVSESVQMKKLRAQYEAMATREHSLLARIESMEKEFQRNLTEKSFIEERYIKLDAAAASVN